MRLQLLSKAEVVDSKPLEATCSHRVQISPKVVGSILRCMVLLWYLRCIVDASLSSGVEFNSVHILCLRPDWCMCASPPAAGRDGVS